MSEPLGSFCLVLHGHLPYVLNHGNWPHGEDWLYEAAAETYLPIHAMVRECVFFNAQPRLAMGLTPVLLEQLAHEQFKDGFERYLEDRIARAGADRKDFERNGAGHMVYLADRWAQWYGDRLKQFREIDRDIPRAFADLAEKGYVEILTSNATHGYMPLLREDACIRAQIRAGLASSERILGFRPKGMWLPECAYRPGGAWQPPIPWSGQERRIGIEHLVGDEGVSHFFVEHHLIEQARSEHVFNDGRWWKVGWDEAQKYPSRGWRSVHEPHGVNSDGTGLSRAVAFARDPVVCEQVWSGTIGYPADGSYMEFHKKWGERRGLRYWKITGNKVDLGDKHLYYPDDIDARIHEHVSHFCGFVKDRLRKHREQTGRHGVVTACFDAELFGHWWFEGPRFLRDVMLSLNIDPEVELCTPAEFLERRPADKVVALPEGSWGDGGDHRVWTNEKVNWMWDIEYRCEALFGKLTFELPWRDNRELREMLSHAARELLLMQASDWPFVIARGQAIDYGIKRFVLHAGRFENLCAIAEKMHRGDPLTELEKFEIEDALRHDVVFPRVDLSWWNM